MSALPEFKRVAAQVPGQPLSWRNVPLDYELGAGEVVIAPDSEPPADGVLDGGVVREKTSEEALDAARLSRLEQLKALRDAIQYDAFEYKGAWYDCSAESQTKIIGKVVAEAVNGEAAAVPDAWRDANNVWQPTEIIDGHKTLKKLANAMDAHIQACYMAFAVHEGAILQHPDPANYSLVSGDWPNTRIDLDE